MVRCLGSISLPPAVNDLSPRWRTLWIQYCTIIIIIILCSNLHQQQQHCYLVRFMARGRLHIACLKHDRTCSVYTLSLKKRDTIWLAINAIILFKFKFLFKCMFMNFAVCLILYVFFYDFSLDCSILLFFSFMLFLRSLFVCCVLFVCGSSGLN